MKPIFTLIVFLIATTTFAQNFHFEPTNVLNKTINTENISDLNIDIIRDATADTIYLEYELISNTLPNEWYQGYCDNHGCWGSLPANGVMSPCYDELNSFIRLSIDPNEIEGSGTVEYYVFESGQYENGLLMTFNVDTPGFLGIQPNNTAEVKFYPNPADNFIHFEQVDQIDNVSIIQLSGQLIQSYSSIPISQRLDISFLRKGIYLVKTTNKSGNIFTQKLHKL